MVEFVISFASFPALTEDLVDPDPIQQFDAWYRLAFSAGLKEPTAMTLATASAEGEPSARMVLLKSFDERGFVFFTNYLSRKGHDLAENPRAALVFYWAELERQVRVPGRVTRTSEVESDLYFSSRAVGSRISAAASQQSSIISSRADLERSWQEQHARYEPGGVPRPEHWGGFRLHPSSIEFWQGRENRLHDRIRYRLTAENVWVVERLAP
jgi:pyridoxamine 5'-phosphate oxidase